MDRLPVFKALGDNTRYAIYLELARASRPLSTADIADALDLHPNTVRPHLDRMREVGLLDVDADTEPSAADLAWARGLVEDPCAGPLPASDPG